MSVTKEKYKNGRRYYRGEDRIRGHVREKVEKKTGFIIDLSAGYIMCKDCKGIGRINKKMMNKENQDLINAFKIQHDKCNNI